MEDFAFNSPPATSTPRAEKRKQGPPPHQAINRCKVQLSMKFNAFSENEVPPPAPSQSAIFTPEHSQDQNINFRGETASAISEPNKDIMTLLQSVLHNQAMLMDENKMILSNQAVIMERLEKLEENTIPKTDVMAHQKVLRETKVLVRRTHQMTCRLSGETDDQLHTEIAMLLPLPSLDAVFDIEEKMTEKNFESAVITYLFTLKGQSADVGEVLKILFTDDVLYGFNWDGKCGKRALSKLKVVNIALFEIFKLQGRLQFEKDLRKNIELSHNRSKQKRYLRKKNN